MCAINGITKNDKALVQQMNEATLHRGPDGSRVWEGEGVTLGHNRLAIIDLADRAAQPMHDTSGRYHIVFNGEIYNYRELKEELRSNYQFQTESDTEVLLVAYIAWGEAMFSRLRGIFAFGIWDSEKRELILARDHMGVKPLYYTIESGVLSFSSEMVGLLSKKTAVLNQESFPLYMEFGYVPGAQSLVSGIQRLPPGHHLTFKNGEVEEHAYYNPLTGTGVLEVPSLRDTHRDIVRTIDVGVARQLVSDRPVGMFLSGGIDSSVVLHHMALHTESVHTFSVGFEMVPGAESEEDKFNADARIGEQTAKVYGARHKTFMLTLEDIRTNLVTAIESLDEPVANPTAISQYLLSKRVRDDGIVVALGGDGGDELFGGYTRHRMAMGGYYFQKAPQVLRDSVAYFYPRLSKLNTPLPAPMHALLMANKVFKKKKILTSDVDFYAKAEEFLTSLYTHVPRGIHPVDAFLYIDRSTWLPEESLARSDRSSMAHGLELRVPLLDVDVVALADTIPVRKKVGPFLGKKILRDAYRGLLPEYLFTQPKRGWVSPGAKWLRDPVIMATVREILSPQYYGGLQELFDWNAVDTMLTDHIEKRGYYLYPLWNIMVLQVWARKNSIVTTKEV